MHQLLFLILIERISKNKLIRSPWIYDWIYNRSELWRFARVYGNSKNLRTTFEIYFVLIDFNQTIADFIQQIHWNHFTCMHINSYFYLFQQIWHIELKNNIIVPFFFLANCSDAHLPWWRFRMHWISMRKLCVGIG